MGGEWTVSLFIIDALIAVEGDRFDGFHPLVSMEYFLVVMMDLLVVSSCQDALFRCFMLIISPLSPIPYPPLQCFSIR